MAYSVGDLKEIIRQVIREEKDQEQQKIDFQDPKIACVGHACECIECYQDIIKQRNLTADFACRDCGLPLGSKEEVGKISRCPNCGSESSPKDLTEDMKERYRKKVLGEE